MASRPLERPMRLSALCALIALLPAAAGRAADDTGPPLPEAERIRWSAQAGYGLSIKVNRGRSREHLLLLVPAANLRLGSRLEYTLEAHVAEFRTPRGYMIGVMPVGARYYFGRGKSVPYFSIGAGIGWTNLVQLDEIDRRFNFLLQGSAGIRRRVSSRAEWTVEARWDHISNGGTELPNLGLNSLVLLTGWRFR